MTEKETLLKLAINLRRKAEEKAARMPENPETLSPEETRRILHELRVHQIELEMQNEELRSAQAELDVAKDRYFDLFDLAPVGYCTISEKGLIREANFTASSLLGVDRSALIKQPITRYILKEDQDIYFLYQKHLLDSYSEISKQTRASRVCELRMAQKDGVQFWARLDGTLVQDTGGASEFRIMISDITDRKRAEASLREVGNALRALLSEKEVLLKEVHHRVKNNLQVITSLISLQADDMADKRLQSGLNDVRDRVRTMALVHEMLYATDDLAQLDFAGYTASLLQYLWRSHDAAAGKVRLNVLLAPMMLPIDTVVPFGLILNELISNVFKHAFPGGGEGEVFVSLAYDPAAGDVCLRVRDNGVGLPPELDWRQVSSLGLRLVQMLAGQIRGTVQTGSGPGTEFQINFKVC
jgi:PAS domain S-box-containing protein